MSLSPSGMIDRASAEISRCIMRIKNKKKDGASGASSNGSANSSAPPSPVLSAKGSSTSSSGGGGYGPPSSPLMERNAETSGGGSWHTGLSTPQKKCLNNQMGLTNIIMMGTPTRRLNNGASYNGHHYHFHSGSSSSHATNGVPTPKFRLTTSTMANGNGGALANNTCSSSSSPPGGPPNIMMDSGFLGYLFATYFHGADKLNLPLVSKYWRDTCYSLGKDYWDKELIPVLNCKGIRQNLLNVAGVRRRFYQALTKRGFTGLKLVGATDEDAEDVLVHFSQGTNLIQTLKLCNSSLTDKGLYSLLDHLSSVEMLELVSCNEITEDGIIKALPLSLLSIVILDCIHVADMVFAALAKLESLQSLTLQAYHVTDAALASFNSKVNSNLTVLKLNSCWELTNQALLHIVSSLPHLETLSLSGCSKVTDEGVEILAENLTSLKSLDLSWCSRITDSSLECIACDLGSLQQLVLDRCSLITDMGIGYLATMASLRVLSIRWCCSIRDQAIHHIISIKKLQFLSIAGCTNISPGTLCSLSGLRDLKELELTNCGVTPSVIQFLRNTLPNCLVVE